MSNTRPSINIASNSSTTSQPNDTKSVPISSGIGIEMVSREHPAERIIRNANLRRGAQVIAGDVGSFVWGGLVNSAWLNPLKVNSQVKLKDDNNSETPISKKSKTEMEYVWHLIDAGLIDKTDNEAPMSEDMANIREQLRLSRSRHSLANQMALRPRTAPAAETPSTNLATNSNRGAKL